MPTVTNFDYNWLQDKPRDVAAVFAARMALRAAPLLMGVRGLRGGSAEEFGVNVALPVFRALAAAWVAGQYPARGAALAAAAVAARDDAYFVAYGPHSAPLASARSAAFAASHAAGTAAVAAGDPDAGYVPVQACESAVEAAIPADFSPAARADSDAIDKGASAAALAALPLWPAGQPGWMPESWKRIEEALLEDNRDWQVWTDWYRARLSGGATDEALEVARVSVAADVWDQGPRAVNAGIARVIAGDGKAASE